MTMKVSIEIIKKPLPEKIVLQCYAVTPKVDLISRYVKAMEGTLSGYAEDQLHQVFLQDIYYIESIDNHLFAYTETRVYELKMKLYEFEELYQEQSFFRCAKALVVNLMKIKNVSSILNGRLSAKLYNGEEIIISRLYTRELKRILSRRQ